MPILGDAPVVVARLSRATSNALRVQLTTPDGAELARAQQKGGAAVLFGFKNGGKSEYTLSGAAGDELRIAVAATTTITKQDRAVGKIVPADGAARLENGACTVLAVLRPHTGSKPDSAWHHPILSPAGHELGVLTLMTVHTGWSDIEAEAIQLMFNQELPQSESTISWCDAQTLRAGHTGAWGRIGRGVHRFLGIAPRVHRIKPRANRIDTRTPPKKWSLNRLESQW